MRPPDWIKWNKKFMEVATTIAKFSKDPSEGVGAVIINQRRKILGTGYNGFARDVEDTPARYENKTVKHRLMLHAEENAIIQSDDSLEGAILYSTKFPCTHCASLAITVGIMTIVCPPPDDNKVEDAVLTKLILEEARRFLVEIR